MAAIKKKKIKKEEAERNSEIELVDKFNDDDLCDDCSLCQAEKFRNKYDRYPNLQELSDFLKNKNK